MARLHKILLPFVLHIVLFTTLIKNSLLLTDSVIAAEPDSRIPRTLSIFDLLDNNTYTLWSNISNGVYDEKNERKLPSHHKQRDQRRNQRHIRSQKKHPRRYPYPTSILPECDPRSCKPPACTCPSYSHPGDFPLHEVPMMIMLTFDDAVSSWNIEYFQRIMGQNFRNPNGCPMRMTFFVCDDGNHNYTLTRMLYEKGHEIASHSVTHRYPESWWARASVSEYRHEFVGQRRRLSRWAGIPRQHVRGLRVPFLAMNGNSVMEIVKSNRFSYDSSCVGAYSPSRDRHPVWPYTLDFAPSEEICEQEGRPTRPFPGVWEVPLTKYSCEDRVGNYMLDECQGHFGNGQASDVVDFLWNQFALHYETRAPMGLFTHATFLRDQRGALHGLIEFLRKVSSVEGVWIVSAGQVIDWMKSPRPISGLKDFQPWGC